MPAAMVPMNGAQNAVCANGQNIRPIEHHAWVFPVRGYSPSGIFRASAWFSAVQP
jgi:hypothetical protein